jgi:hypothetical protein
MILPSGMVVFQKFTLSRITPFKITPVRFAPVRFAFDKLALVSLPSLVLTPSL